MVHAYFLALVIFIISFVTTAASPSEGSLEWLVGNWGILCNARQARLVNEDTLRTVSTNNAPQCNGDYPMIISNLDDEPDTYVNFELEAPFMGSCEVFGIPTTDTDCDENEGRTLSKFRHRGYNSNVKSVQKM